MTKKEYWKAHVAKNPSFADEEKEIRVSVKMLHRLMDEAFDKGYNHHVNLSKSVRDMMNKAGMHGFDLGKFGKF